MSMSCGEGGVGGSWRTSNKENRGRRRTMMGGGVSESWDSGGTARSCGKDGEEAEPKKPREEKHSSFIQQIFNECLLHARNKRYHEGGKSDKLLASMALVFWQQTDTIRNK